MRKDGVVFIDLLGFSNLLDKDEELATKVLNDFYNIVYKLCENYEDIHFKLFSDSLIANSRSVSKIMKFSTALYRECLKKTAMEFKHNNKYLLLPRGAIAYGSFYTERRRDRKNLEKHFIISKALSHAVNAEKKGKGARLLVYYDIENELNVIYDSIDSKCIYSELEDSVGSIKYSDILWPIGGDESKNQVATSKEMLLYAIELFINNRESKNRDQYIGTLRIALLSHFKFIASRFDFEPAVDKLFSFTEDTDSDLWCVLLEALMLSSDSQWLHKKNPVVNKWYCTILLSKKFHHVQDFLKKTNNDFIYKRYVKFHNMYFKES